MDVKHLIYEDDVLAVGLVVSPYRGDDILCLAIRYLPPPPLRSKDGDLIETTNLMGGATDWFILPFSFAAPVGRTLLSFR